MARKKQSQSNRRGRTPLLIVIAICIAALILGGVVIYAALASLGTEPAYAGVDAVISINGDDIVIEFYGGERIDHLQAVRLIIEGYQIPPGVSVISFSGQDKITYPEFLYGISGKHRIGIRGIFDDGTEMLIHQLEFTMS